MASSVSLEDRCEGLWLNDWKLTSPLFLVPTLLRELFFVSFSRTGD